MSEHILYLPVEDFHDQRREREIRNGQNKETKKYIYLINYEERFTTKSKRERQKKQNVSRRKRMKCNLSDLISVKAPFSLLLFAANLQPIWHIHDTAKLEFWEEIITFSSFETLQPALRARRNLYESLQNFEMLISIHNYRTF
jgi:hypothetical protein